MFHSIEKQVASAFRAHIQIRYGIDLAVSVEQPRQSDFGEIAVPAAFQLAKQLRQAPKKIAAELVDEIPPIEGVAAMEVAGNGYINIRLDRAAYGAALLRGEAETAAGSGGKIIVEHTNINPNKAAHSGHLRNAALGDTFVRMLRARGNQVEVQNYIDNTGVQVADVVVGFHRLEHKTPAEVQALIDDPAVRFDYYCWDLYARTSAYYKEHPESLAWRTQTLHAIESGEGEVAELAHLVADAIVQAHLATMLRMGVEYDVLPRESEILHLHFWAAAFELLKEKKAIYYETEGKLAGCWVMPGLSEEGKVIVRSDGTVVYTGKDIAYQLWKFGLLGRDFHYKPLHTYADGRVLWVSTDEETAQADRQFGHGTRVYNVIDTRQSYLQDVVVAGLRALGYKEQADRSVHFNYEMVALSPRCCADLGIPVPEEDRKKPYVEVSGRKGLGVKADDLMDSLIAKALEEVKSRHPEDAEAANRKVAAQIAMAALRYFLLKYTRNTVIAFDLQEALSFVGETGPYVQYTAVRAARVLDKLSERGEKIPDFGAELSAEAMGRQLAGEDFWQL
ncbi:MAG TPA: arginine--tRNA ligase, partial [Candidatus Sulfopaludibacter sp.]|nr:arginine--tRNA ligase [Candidatus Sulfopaludibacter sp.]